SLTRLFTSPRSCSWPHRKAAYCSRSPPCCHRTSRSRTDREVGKLRRAERLFVLSAQDPSALRVHQMRLYARKARHLDVGEVIVPGIISGPSLDVLTCVGTAVEEGRHLALYHTGTT